MVLHLSGSTLVLVLYLSWFYTCRVSTLVLLHLSWFCKLPFFPSGCFQSWKPLWVNSISDLPDPLIMKKTTRVAVSSILCLQVLQPGIQLIPLTVEWLLLASKCLRWKVHKSLHGGGGWWRPTMMSTTGMLGLVNWLNSGYSDATVSSVHLVCSLCALDELPWLTDAEPKTKTVLDSTLPQVALAPLPDSSFCLLPLLVLAPK